MEGGRPHPLPCSTPAGMKWGRGGCAHSSVGCKELKLRSQQQKAREAESKKGRTVQYVEGRKYIWASGQGNLGLILSVLHDSNKAVSKY